MSRTLVIQNRQRTTAIDTRLLRDITQMLLTELLELGDFELGVTIVRAPEMTALNETFLQHEGSTDVITFDYCEGGKLNTSEAHLHGEIFVCIDDARAQARQFRTSWQKELTRYVIHGVLHLLGHDDLRESVRRKMKREENRLVREIGRRFPLSKLARKTGSGARS